MAHFNPESDILVATIGRPHGVRGLMRMHAATDDPASVENFGALHDDRGGVWSVRWVSPGIAALTGADGQEVSDRTVAERLVNRRLYIARERLPAPDTDEFYHADLIGMEAVSADGAALGRVVTVHDYGAGVSLEIDRGLIVPFTLACVPSVDLGARRIVVVPPETVEVEGDLGGDVQVRA